MKKSTAYTKNPETKAVHIWYVEANGGSINENTESSFNFIDFSKAIF